jgi:hypothetical protein
MKTHRQGAAVPFRPRPPKPLPPPSAPSIFQDPAIQAALLKVGATVLDRFIPGVLQLTNQAVKDAVAGKTERSIPTVVLELKRDAQGVYK